MAPEPSDSAKLYALLMGIDCYLPNLLPGGSYYPNLGGCVKDISNVESFLKSNLGLKDENIIKLTATDVGKDEPGEPPESWPTYENMVAAFKKITDMASKGDRVYIHYSGHGGRSKTSWPKLKGSKGLDESLVPTNIGRSESRYFRDLEIAYLLKSMVEKGIIATVVFDSCHSGGATRGLAKSRVRGVSQIDVADRPKESLVASEEELEMALSGKAKATRGAQASMWLPEPEGYVLMAACRPTESANEAIIDGAESAGVFTYWLLDSMRQIRPGSTYRDLHNRILAKVHSQFYDQTPMLEGEGDWLVFGSDRTEPSYAVNVTDVKPESKTVQLNTGQALGTSIGDKFAVFPVGTKDFTKQQDRIAIVKVSELGSTDSWAEIVEPLSQRAIEQGDQAVLLSPGELQIKRTVCMVVQDQDKGLPAEEQKAHLEKVKEAIALEGSGFLSPADQGPCDYQVAISPEGNYEIWDPQGKEFTNLRPAIGISEDSSASKLVKRLVHMCKYHMIQQLDNYDTTSALAGKLMVSLLRAQPGYKKGDRPNPKPFTDQAVPTLKAGEWAFLKIKNLCPPPKGREPENVLNVAVLDLQPDWAIKQIYPKDTDYIPLDPGEEKLIPLQSGLPGDYQEGRDVLKVFATLGDARFRVLELDALDKPIVPTARRSVTRGAKSSPLDKLFEAVAIDKPTIKTRSMDLGNYSSDEWTVGQLELQITRS